MSRCSDFDSAVGPVLSGEDSLEAAHELESFLVRNYPDDDRVSDLLETLALYSPGGRKPYANWDELRAQIISVQSSLRRSSGAIGDDCD